MNAQDSIEIHGRTFNKCHLSDRQWEECITPCSFCQIQEYCNLDDPFCKNDRVCYIDLGAICNEDDYTSHICGECSEYCEFAEHKCQLNKFCVSKLQMACNNFKQ